MLVQRPSESLDIINWSAGGIMAKDLSIVMREMAQRILSEASPSDKAISVALRIAQIAWNACLPDDKSLALTSKEFEFVSSETWKELKSDNCEALIQELMEYRRCNYPRDTRKLYLCELMNGDVQVVWR